MMKTKIKSICLVNLIILASLLRARDTFAWNENQHRWIVSDALDYLEENGDIATKVAVEWLWNTPGYNYMSEDAKVTWLDDPRCTQFFSAACALREEAANTDRYTDLWILVEYDELKYSCLLGIVPSCIIWAVFEGAFHGSGMYSSFDGLYLTALNHLAGAYYPNDLVPRNPGSFSRDENENIGYHYKNPNGECDEFSEGDCPSDNDQMDKFRMLAGNGTYTYFSELLGGMSLQRYNGLTNHQHNVAGGMEIADAEYIPVDNIVEYWMYHWMDNQDVVKLGPALHGSQDILTPHHNYLYLGRGHAQYEAWCEANVEISESCRRGLSSAELCAEFNASEHDYHDSEEISVQYSKWASFFAYANKYENVVMHTAMSASLEAYDENAPEPDDTMFGRAINWQTENEDFDPLSPDYFPTKRDWRKISVDQHRKAVVHTAELIRRAFSHYYDDYWGEYSYCQEVKNSDIEAWYRILPGPVAGEKIETLTADSNYIRLVSDSHHTLHPYYNCDEIIAHPSNLVEFAFPKPFFGVDTIVHTAEISLSGDSDWYDSEGDRLVISVKLIDGNNEFW
jgi:hypothetical protein